MSSLSCSSYKDRDRVLVLEKMVEDLKQLTCQQNLTIKQLEEESLAKSSKISSLLILDGKASLSLNSRPSLHLSSHLSNRHTTQPSVIHGIRKQVDMDRIGHNKMELLIKEREFWKRHFQLAEKTITDLQEDKNSFKPPQFPSLQEISVNREPESLYLKKLLEENLELKQKIAKHTKTNKSVQIVEPEADTDQEVSPGGKENINSYSQMPPQYVPTTQPRNIPPQQLRPPYNPLLEREVQHLTEHNKCLQHQVCKLKNELLRKADQFSCSCQNNTKLNKTGPKPAAKSCAKCKNHLCRSGSQVKFEEKLDFSSIHLCSHLACLQRQVCHLKLELEQQNRRHVGPGGGVGQGRQDKLRTAEIAKLETKCDKLLDQKKNYLERISELQKQVDTLLASSNTDSQVKNLILNIESQRDNYKHQVEKLIKDLQGSNDVIIVQDNVAPNNNVELDTRPSEPSSRKTIVSEPRKRFELPSNIRTKAIPKQSNKPQNYDRKDTEPENFALELLETKTALAAKADELADAQSELAGLRLELEHCLALLESYRVKQTQTSPRLERGDEGEKRRKELEAREKDVEEQKQRLDKMKNHLEKWKKDLEGEKAKFEREQSNIRNVTNASTPIYGGGREDFFEEGRQLKNKIDNLEQQLTQTENTLRNCQNLLSETSNKNYDLNSQIMKLKQAGNESRKTVDDLQLKLDKKEDLIRRIVEDKDNLLLQLDDSREKLQSLKTQVNQKTERLDYIDQSKDNLEKKVSQLQVTVKQLERRLMEKESSVQKLQEANERMEDLNRNLKIENESLRLESDHNRNEVDKISEESRSKSGEIIDIKSELLTYITEVKRFEELLDLKESDRVTLLKQYDELSKEVTAYESSNRALEMAAANLMLEVRSREDDLEAAKQRCDSLEAYVQEILDQNEQFRLQVTTLSSKLDILSSDLKSNRVTRDSVLSDLEGVNQLAVRLNTEKIELMGRIGNQNSEVENLQADLVKLREDLLSAMGQLEEERHRARTLQNMVTNTTMQEERQTVIRTIDSEIMQETEWEDVARRQERGGNQ